MILLIRSILRLRAHPAHWRDELAMLNRNYKRGINHPVEIVI